VYSKWHNRVGGLFISQTNCLNSINFSSGKRYDHLATF